MKVKLILGLVFLIIWINQSQAQSHSHIQGIVKGEENGKLIPLFGANVYWSGSVEGTTTDVNGHYELENSRDYKLLVISFVGYLNDTIESPATEELNIELKSSVSLEEFEVVHRQKSTEISFLNPLKVEKIGEKELLKAACCNLSESFETSPSVDVSFTDAITGTRQIQMLGLAGPYTQITRENMPDIRGLSSLYGFTYIPGTWIESIQLNKGAGSVANGFESIAGQINVELRKPESADRVYYNLYVNEGGRLENNLNLSHKINDKLSTAFLLHNKYNSRKMDRNEDGFLDNPLSNQIIGVNRWKFAGDNGLRMQFGVRGTYIDNEGGQMEYDHSESFQKPGLWGMNLETRRADVWTKIGKVFEDRPWRSLGLQLAGTFHDQNSFFGENKYDAFQKSAYANFLYQGIIGTTDHKFRTGLSYQHDEFIEDLNEMSFERKEMVPGAYFEHTFSRSDKFGLVSGIRADYHNIYGTFFTPRIHARYALNDQLVFRASGGRGQRTASVIAENSGMLASSRKWIFPTQINNKPYGLNPEVAWNYGVNLAYCFKLDYREGTFSMDFYKTDFVNQAVIDRDTDSQKVLVYNLDGKSYSNSFQAQLDYEVVKRLDMRLAYRWYDVKTNYSGVLLSKPLIASNRAFINLAYETRKLWKFDGTFNWQGVKRIPQTIGNPEGYSVSGESPAFYTINAQISKNWNEIFEIYLGVENLLNFRQDNPIVSSENPFSIYFDSSLIWGPVFGRNTYLGLRYYFK